MITIELISQIFIPVFTGLSVYLVSRTDKFHRWGYVVGLCNQPFWIYTAINNEQYGILALAGWCTFSYIKGIYNRFIKKEVQN